MTKKLYAAVLLSITIATATAQQKVDSLLLKKVSDEIMLNGTCYENLRVLTKQIGHRLSGTVNAEKAVEWGVKTMQQAGADTVWLQPVDVPVWVRGKESLKIKVNNTWESVPMLSLGNTEGTNGKMLESQLICVPDLAAFEQLDGEQVKGKVVFFNYRFRQDIISTFEGYGDAVKYRWVAVNKAAEKGAKAVIIRSISTGEDDAPHTGSSRYNDGVAHIPAIAIGNHSADKIAAACSNGKVLARLTSNCGMKGIARSYNVIGELKGASSPHKYMIVSGHLDSWDVGEGAHDDGAGCVQVIEVVRTMKSLNLKPRNTLRAVLYMNEENGVKGGHAYADSAKAKNEQHIFAMESDAGGFVPRGIGLVMPNQLRYKVQSWAPLFKPYGIWDFEQEEGGVDIGPLKKLQVPLAGLLPDPQRYFDLHHSPNDVFETVSHRELKLGAFAMTAMILLVDEQFD